MPNRIPFFVLDVFTGQPFSGNPAGVFFDIEGALSPDEMRCFAGEISLESAFVLPVPPGDTSGADFCLRYFTGVTEVPFCGHATVGATVALARAGRLPDTGKALFSTPVGIVPVAFQKKEMPPDKRCEPILVTMRQKPKFKGEPLSIAVADDITAVLGGDPSTLEVSGLSMQVYSTGTPWLFAPLRDPAFIETIEPDREAVAALSKRFKAFGVYAFALVRENNTLTIRSRCFAPGAGLNEDPVTGSASGALGWYLFEHGLILPDEPLIARQGNPTGRNGVVKIIVRTEGSNDSDGIASIDVSGTAIIVADGSFLV